MIIFSETFATNNSVRSGRCLVLPLLDPLPGWCRQVYLMIVLGNVDIGSAQSGILQYSTYLEPIQ